MRSLYNMMSNKTDRERVNNVILVLYRMIGIYVCVRASIQCTGNHIYIYTYIHTYIDIYAHDMIAQLYIVHTENCTTLTRHTLLSNY